MSDPMEVRSWSGRHLGQRVLIYDSVTSTNDLAAECTEPGTVFIAREQLAGRGQHGRVWQSELGSSLLMSVSLKPPMPLGRPVLLTAWASISIADSIFELVDLQARLKWPNDLFLNEKKVCGILIEQGRNLVLGLGLNLTQTREEFAARELPQATSLLIESGRVISPLVVAEAVVQRLDVLYEQLVQGQLDDLETEWRWRIGLVGRAVQMELLDGSQVLGRLNSLTFSGAELTLANGSLFRTPPETIRHIWPV